MLALWGVFTGVGALPEGPLVSSSRLSDQFRILAARCSLRNP